MSLEQRAKIIHTTETNDCGIRELIQTLKLKNANAISLLRRMEDEGLITIADAKGTKRGRPKKHIKVTPLGAEFYDAYKKLNLKRLNARKADLEHATKDALYAKRIAERGHSTFQVFMELNMIACNIEKSSKISSTL
jgi:DNA-binding PadR family transcriptional regulator